MPEFNNYIEVDVDDFVSACNKQEIDELIDELVFNGYLSKPLVEASESKKMGLMESMFLEKMSKLAGCYYRLTPEEEKTLEKMFEKYV
jgi:hypothetical protein